MRNEKILYSDLKLRLCSIIIRIDLCLRHVRMWVYSNLDSGILYFVFQPPTRFRHSCQKRCGSFQLDWYQRLVGRYLAISVIGYRREGVRRVGDEHINADSFPIHRRQWRRQASLTLGERGLSFKEETRATRCLYMRSSHGSQGSAS